MHDPGLADGEKNMQIWSECVRYLIRLGWSLLLVEPDRKSRVREGDGLSLAANLTADHNSDLAIDDTWGILHFDLSQKAEKRCLLRCLAHIFLRNTCATKTRWEGARLRTIMTSTSAWLLVARARQVCCDRPPRLSRVASRTRVTSGRGARRLCGIDRDTRVANISAFTLLKDSWMRRASFTRKLHCDPEGFRVTHREIMRWVNIYLVFHKLDRQNMCVWVTGETKYQNIKVLTKYTRT
jgi:hypothetical protein